nr:hypothetical protein [Tanacetum cinerariifolium]
MRVNEYFGNREINLRKQNFNRWVLVVGDGKLPAKKKEIEDEPTWIEIPKEFLLKSNCLRFDMNGYLVCVDVSTILCMRTLSPICEPVRILARITNWPRSVMMSLVPLHMPRVGFTFRISITGSSLFKKRECEGILGKFRVFKNSTGYR